MDNDFCCVYVLKSEKDKNWYIGCTENLKIRFEQHTNGVVPATRDRRLLELIYYEACRDLRDARRRELYLKTTYGHRYLQSRLKSYFTGY